jgi:hypothetical protein
MGIIHHLNTLCQEKTLNSTQTTQSPSPSPPQKPTPIIQELLFSSPHQIFPLCPIKALTKLFRLHPKGEDSPLFSRAIGGPFNRQFFVDKIKELLLRAGISSYFRILRACHKRDPNEVPILHEHDPNEVPTILNESIYSFIMQLELSCNWSYI